MRRRFLFVAATLAVAVPGFAAEAPEAGRYQLAPGAEGFVRLDTRTGAMSHCTRQEGVWRCQPVIEETGLLAAELDALSAKVDGLAAALAALGARVDGLVAGVDRPGPAVTVEPASPTVERGVVATAVERLFALVRLLKHGRAEA
jgi:hypothetical protein